MTEHAEREALDTATLNHHNKMKALDELRAKIMIAAIAISGLTAGVVSISNYRQGTLALSIAVLGFLIAFISNVILGKKMAGQTASFDTYLENTEAQINLVERPKEKPVSDLARKLNAFKMWYDAEDNRVDVKLKNWYFRLFPLLVITNIVLALSHHEKIAIVFALVWTPICVWRYITLRQESTRLLHIWMKEMDRAIEENKRY